MTPQRDSFAVWVLTASSLLVLVSSVVPGAFSEGVFAAVAVVFPLALAALGRSRSPASRRPMLWTLGLLLVVLGGAMAGLFLLPRSSGVWLLLGGLFAVPLVVSSLGFAWTYDAEAGSGS